MCSPLFDRLDDIPALSPEERLLLDSESAVMKRRALWPRLRQFDGDTPAALGFGWFVGM